MSSRVRLPNEPPLLDPERAIRLAEEASAFFDAPGDGRHELSRLAMKTAMDAAHVAIETAIDTGDPRVLAAALSLARQAALGDEEEHFEHEIASAAEPIFPALTEIDNGVRDCARSASAFLRVHTARGLGPRALRSLRGESPEDEADLDAEAAGIVFALTKDKDADVRAAAREALGGAAPPAWATFFPRDPLAAMPAAEAARLRAPLDRAAEALETGVDEDAQPLAEPIAELPDELAAPLLDAWIRTPYALSATNVEPLLERWLALDPDGERTLLWLRGMKKDAFELDAGAALGAVLRRCPAEPRRSIALTAARALPELYRADRMPAVEIAEAIVEHGWPDDADPTPLLEAALGAPLAEAGLGDDEAPGYVSNTLVTAALAPRASFDALIEPLVDAFLAGTPSRWARVEWKITERLLAVSHPRLRAHAETVLREGEGAALTWALRYLAGGGHDPSVDAPVDELVASAARDPRLRPALLKAPELRATADRLLRAQLAAGELPPTEAIAVAAAFHDDEASLSPEEWAEVRRARLRIEKPSHKAAAIDLLPTLARWTEEDHAFVAALIDDHGDSGTVARRVCVGLRPDLSAPPCPELVPLFERLLARASEDSTELVLQTLKSCRGEDPYS